MAPIELYPFRFRDPAPGSGCEPAIGLRSRRFKARHREWEIDGSPEIRGDTPVQMFQPQLRRVADQPLELQPHLAMPSAIDATERFLLRLFLRRFITWCARQRRFAQMQAAAPVFAQC